MPETRIVGIDIDAEPERVRSDVIAYARAAADLIGTRFDENDVEVVAGRAGLAYGVPHAATIEAIKLAGALEALPVDPVYSGKGLAGLIALVEAMATGHRCYLHPYRRSPGSVRLPECARHLIGPSLRAAQVQAGHSRSQCFRQFAARRIVCNSC
jgi:hypothetical protein